MLKYHALIRNFIWHQAFKFIIQKQMLELSFQENEVKKKAYIVLSIFLLFLLFFFLLILSNRPGFTAEGK